MDSDNVCALKVEGGSNSGKVSRFILDIIIITTLLWMFTCVHTTIIMYICIRT